MKITKHDGHKKIWESKTWRKLFGKSDIGRIKGRREKGFRQCLDFVFYYTFHFSFSILFQSLSKEAKIIFFHIGEHEKDDWKGNRKTWAKAKLTPSFTEESAKTIAANVFLCFLTRVPTRWKPFPDKSCCWSIYVVDVRCTFMANKTVTTCWRRHEEKWLYWLAA